MTAPAVMILVPPGVEDDDVVDALDFTSDVSSSNGSDVSGLARSV